MAVDAIPLHGSVISIDNAGGTPVDVSDFVQKGMLKVIRPVGVYHTLGELSSEASQGGLSWELELEIVKTKDANGAYKLLRDWLTSSAIMQRNRTITIDDPDSNTGSERYSGEWYFEGFDPISTKEGGKGDPQILKANFKNHGPITPSTI